MDISKENRKILELLAREFPNRRAAFAEIINLQAILNLPKGTEHFLSDLHGEYEAFNHILNNCSGVIREKVSFLFGDTMTPAEQAEFCTLIYYPQDELERMKQGGEIPRYRYKQMLQRLIELTAYSSSKYSLQDPGLHHGHKECRRFYCGALYFDKEAYGGPSAYSRGHF